MINGTNFVQRRKAVAFAVVTATIVFCVASALIARDVSLAQVVTFARSLRQVWWLPLAYIAAYALLALLSLPTQLLSILGPIVWGWAVGGSVEWIAATLGAIPPYLISRSAFRESVEKKFGEQRIDSFSLLLVFRLVPIIPYPILNYIAGLSVVAPLPYVIASAIGMMPSIYIFAYFVDAVAAGVMQPSQVALRVTIAGVALAIFVVVIRLLARVVQPPQARGGTSDREDGPRSGAGPGRP